MEAREGERPTAMDEKRMKMTTQDPTSETSFTYQGEYTREISFPLGGIGGGCIGLGGNGQLRDWEIFNHPNKCTLNGFSHFAVRAEKAGHVLDARILQGDLEPPYTGAMSTPPALIGGYIGYGFGPWRENLCGMPHFQNHSFRGGFPFAWLDFEEDGFPGKAKLCAWSPFIPGNDEDSSLPSACFEITLSNDTDETMGYTVFGVLGNPFHIDTATNRHAESGGLQQLILSSGGDKADVAYGDLTLTTDAETTSAQDYWRVRILVESIPNQFNKNLICK